MDPDTADTGRNLFSGIPCSLAVPMYHYPLVSDLRKRPPRSLFQLKMIRSKQKRHNYSIFDKFFNFFSNGFFWYKSSVLPFPIHAVSFLPVLSNNSTFVLHLSCWQSTSSIFSYSVGNIAVSSLFLSFRVQSFPC